MELWIRSQDKEDLLVVHNLGLAYKGKYGFMDKIGDIDGYCICEFINDYHVKLGTYKTKERALEVLDEIQNILKPQKVLLKVGKPIVETCDGTIYREPDEYDIKEPSTYVYEMPKE
jgi:hypothetical protein